MKRIEQAPLPLASSASIRLLKVRSPSPLVIVANGVAIDSTDSNAPARQEVVGDDTTQEEPSLIVQGGQGVKMPGGLTLQSASKLKLIAANQRRKIQSRQRRNAAVRLAVTLEGEENAALAKLALTNDEGQPPKPEPRQPIGAYETKDNKWRAVIHGELEKFMYPSLRLEALYDTRESTSKLQVISPPATSSMPPAEAVDAVMAATTTVKWEVEKRFQNATQSAPVNGHPRVDDVELTRMHFDTQLEAAEGLLRKRDMQLLEAKRQQGYLASIGAKYVVDDASKRREENGVAAAMTLGRERGASLYAPHIVNSPQLIPRLPHTRKIIKEIQRHTTNDGQIQYYADKHNLFKKWKKLQVSELHKTISSPDQHPTIVPHHESDDETSDDEMRALERLSPRSLFYHECAKKQILPEPIFSRIHEVPALSKKRLLPLPTATKKLSTLVATLVQAVHERHAKHEDLVPARDGTYATKKHHLALHLHHFGLGDAKMDALSTSLQHFQSIHVLDLSDNRLTDASIIPLLESLEAATVEGSASSPPLRPLSSGGSSRGVTPISSRRRGNDLRVLNLSQNDLGVAGCAQIATFLGVCPQLTHLDLSHTKLGGTDAVAPLTSAIETHRSLQVVNMAYNTIGVLCGGLLGDMLSQPSCAVVELDVSWNKICKSGAIAVGRSLRTNTMLCKLNLAMNRFSDAGAEQLASALACNATLTDLDLSRNNLGGRSAIAFAFYLRTNRSLLHLRLEDNPIGATGAKALLRTVSLGSPCEFHVAAHDIESPSGEKDPIFDRMVPSTLSPFTLSTGASPYAFAVASELVDAALQDRTCSLSELSFVDDRNPKKPVTTALSVDESRKTVVEILTNKPWTLPRDYGIFHTSVSFSPPPMRVTPHLTQASCEALIRIIERGFSSREKASLLALAVNDFYLTTDLADLFVEKLRGVIDVVEIVGRLWPCLLDGDRVYRFLQRHLTPLEQRRLIDSFSVTTIQFTTANPTGRWMLNLGDRGQRKLAIWFAILNAHENALAAERHPRRTDASQYGRAFNWRNASYNRKAIHLNYTFFDRLPTTGVLEFDFVSTVRHEDVADAVEIQDDALETLLVEIGMEVFSIYIPLHKRKDLKYQLVLFHLAIANQFVTSTQAHRVLQYFPKNYETCRLKIIMAVHRMLIDMENLGEMLDRLVVVDRRRVYTSLGYLNVVSPLAVDHVDFEVDFERDDDKMLLRALVDLSMSCPMDMIRIESERSTVLVLYSMYQTNTVPSQGRMCFRYVSHPIASRTEFLKVRSAIFKHFLCGERLRGYVDAALAASASIQTPPSSASPQSRASSMVGMAAAVVTTTASSRPTSSSSSAGGNSPP